MSGLRGAADARFARRLLRAIPSILLYLAAGFVAFFLWPTSLGGCTTLTVVSGRSMEPTYHTGDIVVSRCGTPQVGDVVVYQPRGYEGARIIHRIVGGDAHGWVVQGDNNGWLDPFEPTNDEVLGVARIHLPKIGLAAKALMSPLIWVSLIVLALAILVWPAGDDPAEDDPADDGDRVGEGGGAVAEPASHVGSPT